MHGRRVGGEVPQPRAQPGFADAMVSALGSLVSPLLRPLEHGSQKEISAAAGVAAGRQASVSDAAGPDFPDGDSTSVQKHWALLIAGSSMWANYRHQSDVAHAYQVGTGMRKHVFVHAPCTCSAQQGMRSRHHMTCAQISHGCVRDTFHQPCQDSSHAGPPTTYNSTPTCMPSHLS